MGQAWILCRVTPNRGITAATTGLSEPKPEHVGEKGRGRWSGEKERIKVEKGRRFFARYFHWSRSSLLLGCRWHCFSRYPNEAIGENAIEVDIMPDWHTHARNERCVWWIRRSHVIARQQACIVRCTRAVVFHWHSNDRVYNTCQRVSPVSKGTPKIRIGTRPRYRLKFCAIVPHYVQPCIADGSFQCGPYGSVKITALLVRSVFQCKGSLMLSSWTRGTIVFESASEW